MTTPTSFTLSVVVPVYNEEERLVRPGHYRAIWRTRTYR